MNEVGSAGAVVAIAISRKGSHVPKDINAKLYGELLAVMPPWELERRLVPAVDWDAGNDEQRTAELEDLLYWAFEFEEHHLAAKIFAFGREHCGMTWAQAKDLESTLAQDAFIVPLEYLPLIDFEFDDEEAPAIFVSKADGTPFSIEPFVERHLDAEGLMLSAIKEVAVARTALRGETGYSECRATLTRTIVERESLDEGVSPALVEGDL